MRNVIKNVCRGKACRPCRLGRSSLSSVRLVPQKSIFKPLINFHLGSDVCDSYLHLGFLGIERQGCLGTVHYVSLTGTWSDTQGLISESSMKND